MKTELEKLLKEKQYKFYKKNGVVIVTHQGNVDLESLTSITTDIKFENQGNVDLRSLTSITTRGMELSLKHVDGYTMIVNSTKEKDGFIIYSARFMGGGEIEKLKKCFVVEKGEFYSHGETLREAIADVNFKYMQENFDLSELIKEIKDKQTVSVEEYRLLTGACKMGVSQFMESNKITVAELPLEKVLEITSGAYGGSRIRELLS